MRRHGGTILLIYGVKRRDLKKIRVLLAAAGIFVPDMTRPKRCGFSTTLHYHVDDWKSPSGRTAMGYIWCLEAVVPPSQAPCESKDYEGDLEEAWTKI
jgi:hypothetical protein